MGACGGCRHNAVPLPGPASLFQIRRGYRTRWNNLAFTVETDSGDWTSCVQDPGRRETLYTARRAGAHAAQVAAAEFAIFQVLGPSSPVYAERLVKELDWQEYA